jgi:hypothetical protein
MHLVLQKNGFDLCTVFRNSILKKKGVKPEISMTGYHDIAVLHEVEFEYLFDKHE